MGETSMIISMIIVGYVILFGGLGIFLQGWRELYRAHIEKRLATGGLYCLVRHPQYTRLFIGHFGQFGAEYLEYKRRVPSFFPVKGNWRQFMNI